MDLKRKVYETIKEYKMLNGKKNVVLGLSGGPDSLVLFNVLKELSEDYIKTKGKFGFDIRITPVHINHMIRSDSDFDQEFVESISFGETVNPAVSYKYDCEKLAKENKLSTEEMGRNLRYSSFREVAKTLESPVIAIAQNLDDQVETILFRIIRGTSINGLSGISYIRKDESGFDIIRPLLNISRKEIEEYVIEKGLNPRRDYTNELPIYTRNKIRLEIIPKLKEINPNILETINRLSESAKIENSLKENLIKDIDVRITLSDEKLLEKVNDIYVNLSISKLKELDRALRYEIYIRELKEIGLEIDLTLNFLKGIDSLLTTMNHEICYSNLPNGFIALKRKDNLLFTKS